MKRNEQIKVGDLVRMKTPHLDGYPHVDLTNAIYGNSLVGVVTKIYKYDPCGTRIKSVLVKFSSTQRELVLDRLEVISADR